jgi:hypothetical protein
MNNKSRISVVCDSYAALEDVILQNYIADHYSFPIVNASVSDEKISELVDYIRTEHTDVKIDFIDLNTVSKYYYIEDKGKFFIEAVLEHKNKAYTCNIYASEYHIANDLYKMMRNFEPGSSDVYLEVDSFYADPQSGLQTRKEFKNYIDIVDATKAYYPYLNTDVLFKKFSLSSESILMLVGQPGVGKTKLVALYEKFMFENPDLFELNVDSVTSESYFKVAYIKNEDILASDSFWESINKLSYNLIFLDDADNCLLPRDSDTMTNEDVNRKKFISQLLSFTDGINENSTKLIITTNRSVDDIDIAVLRRGRTFDILELQALSHDEAKEIWLSKNLTDDDFEELFKEKDVILPSELGAEIKLKIKMNEREEELGEYLLRDGISKIHSFRNKRRTIGI